MSDGLNHYVAEVLSAPKASIPTDRHVFLDYAGWNAFPVGPMDSGEPTFLRWAQLPLGSQARIRLSLSVDHREDVLIEAFLPQSGKVIGTFDIRYPAVCEPVEISILREELEAVSNEGLGLRMIQGEKPIWFVTGSDGSTVPAALQPHIIVPVGASPEREFIDRMLSLASVQAFGWLEGCVLDGLYDLYTLSGGQRVRSALKEHLDLFLMEDGMLRYIDTRSAYYENRIYGTEGTLPFAIIAQFWPDHPSIDIALSFWERRIENGIIRDGSAVTAEGCYIGAYPMAVIGVKQDRPDFSDLSMKQLLFRTETLFPGESFFPQVRGDGTRPFASWGRGCAWYLLGYVRTLAILEAHGVTLDERLKDECRRFAEWVLKYQHPNGTWSAYVDDPLSGSDTSGTAGLGAAFAIGVNAGILPDKYMDRAALAMRGLLTFLTPDGFLTGASPENKGGERLQRGGYRSISQISMGLMAQLVAAMALHERENGPSKVVGSVINAFGLDELFTK